MGSLRDKGVEKLRAVYGGQLPTPPAEGEDEFYDYMLETLFGQLWSDPALSVRDRRLALLGVIAAQGEEMTFKIQARAAMLNGELSAEQLEKLVLFLTQYVGYPKMAKLRMALLEVIGELDPQDKEP